ncbi:unnamed protein product [Umbelopsis vinacea]
MKARLYWFRYFFKYIVSRELKKANIQLPSDPAQLELVQQKHEAIIWQKLKNGELEYLNTYQFWTILFHHYGITGDGVISKRQNAHSNVTLITENDAERSQEENNDDTENVESDEDMTTMTKTTMEKTTMISSVSPQRRINAPCRLKTATSY